MTPTEALFQVSQVADTCRRDSKDKELDLTLRENHHCIYEILRDILNNVDPPTNLPSTVHYVKPTENTY